MLDLLCSHPLLTVFLVVALGAILGAIPFGPIRFGAAGALFVGLALAAARPQLGEGMELLQGLGLALFVYSVGVGAGTTFLSQFRRQLPLMGIATASVLIAAVVAIVGGHLAGLPKALTTGLFTGALTAAPALDTAAKLTGSHEATVGYALAYPLAVIVGIVIAAITVGLKWKGRNDVPSLAGQGLVSYTVEVHRYIPVRDVPGMRTGEVRMSYLRRDKHTRVVAPGEDLVPGDEVVVVGVGEAPLETVEYLGQLVEEHLADDRSEVDFEWFICSNPEVSGRTIAELNLPARFGAQVTRIRRGDLDLLATDETIIEPGDHVAVVAPRDEMEKISEFFGDSERRVSEIDAVAVGIGLVIGMIVGSAQIPMPGDMSFSLGPAAGPLVVGMVLGGLRRTGPLVWALPQAANLTMRQLGLLFFLAGLGLVAGPSFAKMATSPEGFRGIFVSAAIVLASCLGTVILAYFAGLSAPRTAGAVAGGLGQPAVLSAAQDRVADERIENAYAALFAFSMIIKIILVPAIFAF